MSPFYREISNNFKEISNKVFAIMNVYSKKDKENGNSFISRTKTQFNSDLHLNLAQHY